MKSAEMLSRERAEDKGNDRCDPVMYLYVYNTQLIGRLRTDSKSLPTEPCAMGYPLSQIGERQPSV